MSWPSGKYRQQHASPTNTADVSADSETWSDYVPVAVHSIPLDSSATTALHSPSISGGGAGESHSDRDIENLAIEIAELQQLMDRVGSKVPAPPRALSTGPDASSDQAELREHAEMMHHHYVSSLGMSDSVSPVTRAAVGALTHPDESSDSSMLKQQLLSAQSANDSLQKENAALAKLLAEHFPHLQGGQHQAPIEPTALDLPNSLKYSPQTTLNNNTAFVY